MEYVPASLGLVRLCKLDLNTVYTVDTIDKEDQDEDKCDLHSILQLRYQWALASEETMSMLLRNQMRQGGRT